MNLLLLDGRPVAFAYNYVYQGSIYGLRKGFDPEFAAVRPGLVLDRMMVEDDFRRGDQLHDLGVGSLAIKRPWQTAVATSYRCHALPAGDLARATAAVEALADGPDPEPVRTRPAARACDGSGQQARRGSGRIVRLAVAVRRLAAQDMDDLIEDQQHAGAAGGSENTQRADGVQPPSPQRPGKDGQPHGAAGDAQGERGQWAGRLADRQHDAGQQPGQTAQADPDQDDVGPVLGDLGEFEIGHEASVHGYTGAKGFPTLLTSKGYRRGDTRAVLGRQQRWAPSPQRVSLVASGREGRLRPAGC